MNLYPHMKPLEERVSGAGRYLVLDSEAISLVRGQRVGDLSSMHCICTKDDVTNELFVFFDPYEMRDPNNREELEYEGLQNGYLADGLAFLMEAECLIGQNVSGYDAHSFEKTASEHWDYDYFGVRTEGKCLDLYPFKLMDTYNMSCVLNPERRPPKEAYGLGRGNVGAHSIEAHGMRMQRYKPDNEDWSKLTDHMIHRCSEDTHIGQDFYHYLMAEWFEQMQRPNQRTGLNIGDAYMLELRTGFTIARQGLRGFRLDCKLAWEKYKKIDGEMVAVEADFRPFIPLQLCKKPLKVPVDGYTHGSECSTQMGITKKLTPKQWCEYTGKTEGTQKDWLAMFPCTQDNTVGEYTSEVTKHFPEARGHITDHKDPLVAGAFTPVRFKQVSLGSKAVIKEMLYDRGWRGVEYSDSDQALIEAGKQSELKPWAGKIEEKSMELWNKTCDVPEWCQGVGTWYILSSRRSQILNKGDLEYFAKHKQFPNQKGKGRMCRGLLAIAYNKALGMTQGEHYARMGEFCTDPDEDWRVAADAFPNATNTSRMRHKGVVNIPSRGLYPLRDLFIATKGKLVIGCDGAGLELRMLAHFLNDPEYQEIVLNGDIHTHNQNLAGLPKRDMAKTFIYAFLYGSGIANLAKVCGMSETEMAKRIANFKAELPALPLLISRIEAQGNAYGYLLGIDGRQSRIRFRDGKLLVHTMLNVLLQTTGSLSMKYSLMMAEDEMLERGIMLDKDGHPAWVANIHDEYQAEVEESEVLWRDYVVSDWKAEEKIQYTDENGIWSAPIKVAKQEDGSIMCRRAFHKAGDIMCRAMVSAGEKLNLRIPLAGEYKIGTSWADTH